MAKQDKQETKGTAKPSTTTKSEMLRVGLDFAHWAREQAEKEGLTLAQFTDTIPGAFELMLDS